MNTYFIRHGDSDASGQLSPQWIIESAKTWERLASWLFGMPARIITSPRERCVQTAKIIAHILDAPLSADPRLSEGYLGVTDAEKQREIEQAGGFEHLWKHRLLAVLDEAYTPDGALIIIGHNEQAEQYFGRTIPTSSIISFSHAAPPWNETPTTNIALHSA